MQPKSLLGSKYSLSGANTFEGSNAGSKGPRQTNASTISIKKSLGGVEKTNLPGPGSYEYKQAFPKGPKAVIQTKGKWDSLFLTKIAQNISPGPAKYSVRGPGGGTH